MWKHTEKRKSRFLCWTKKKKDLDKKGVLKIFHYSNLKLIPTVYAKFRRYKDICTRIGMATGRVGASFDDPGPDPKISINGFGATGRVGTSYHKWLRSGTGWIVIPILKANLLKEYIFALCYLLSHYQSWAEEPIKCTIKIWYPHSIFWSIWVVAQRVWKSLYFNTCVFYAMNLLIFFL